MPKQSHSPPGTPSTPPPVYHKITSHTPSITKFAGNVNGVCADVDIFLDSLTNHLESLQLASELDKLAHAKSFLDLTRGDLAHYCQSWKFKGLTNYDEFKEYLRSIYGIMSSDDIVRSLSHIFRDCGNSDEQYAALGGRIYQLLNSWKLKANSNPQWFVTNSISLDNFCQILHLSLTLSHLPKQLVESFKHKFVPTDDLVSIKREVQENRNKIPGLDTSVLDNNPRVTVNKVNTQSPVRAINNAPQSLRQACNICRKSGHSDRNCYFNPNFCSLHNSYNHGAAHCRQLRYQLNQNYGPRMQSRSPSRNRRSFQQRNRYRSQSRGRFRQPRYSQPNQSTFQGQGSPGRYT